MKYLFIVFLFVIYLSAFSQESCKPYLPAKKGAQWEVTSYSAKGKEEGKSSYELLDISTSNDGIIYKIKMTAYDKKRKESMTNTFDAHCNGGQFQFNMAFKLDAEAMKAYKDMDVSMDASDLVIPDMATPVGEPLADATMAIKVNSNGTALFTMNILITDRKVLAKESKTTSAGTFDCLKLTSTIGTKMMVNIETTSIEWYAEGVGMVRSESYNKKGTLTGYSELTMLK